MAQAKQTILVRLLIGHTGTTGNVTVSHHSLTRRCTPTQTVRAFNHQRTMSGEETVTEWERMVVCETGELRTDWYTEQGRLSKHFHTFEFPPPSSLSF